MPKQTFVCDFGDGLTCTTIVNFTRSFQGRSPVVKIDWSRKPTANEFPAVLPRYRNWMHGVLQAGVDRTSKGMLYALQIDRDGWEIWVYGPNENPELINTVNGKDFPS